MSSQRALLRLGRLAEKEHERDAELLEALRGGAQLDASDVLGSIIPNDAAVYPAGLIVDDFLPLALALSETVFVRVPSLFTVAEYEEVVGIDYADFLQLIDRGLITPILNDYTLYKDPGLIVPIVNEKRRHLTEQRVLLNLLAGSENAWANLVQGLADASELFPQAPLLAEDLGDDVQFQGIHVAYATLCAIGYGEIVKDVTDAYRLRPESEIFDAVRRLSDTARPSVEEVAFVLTTFLSGFFADCVGLGATGQFDTTYEQVLKIPGILSDRVAFLPTAFGKRLVEWLDLSLPRRLASRDLDELLDSDARAALTQSLFRFKRKVEAAAFSTAADEAAAIRESLTELDHAYRSMSSIERYGSLLSSISFAAIPLTLAAGLGLTDAIAGGLASAATKTVLDDLAENDALARHAFNPILSRLGPWKMDATTFQLCRLRERAA